MIVKNAAVSAKKLSALLKKIGDAPPPAFPPAPSIPMAAASPGEAAASPGAVAGAGGSGAPSAVVGDPIAVLVASMLLWESTTDKAIAAYTRLAEHVVDFNDLRVCMPQETLEIIGPRYPRALDRCQRLRAVLRSIYLREHAVNLNRVATSGKREAKKYIETLEGIVPYAAARVLVLSFDVHAIPVDDQLRTQLIEAEVAEEGVETPELANWLTGQTKPGEGAAVHYALQAWVDSEMGDKPASKKAATTVRQGKSSVKRGAKAAAS